MNTQQQLRDILSSITKNSTPQEWPADYVFAPGDLDSLDIATLALNIEETLSVTVDDEDLPELNSIDSILRLLEKSGCTISD